MTDEPRQAPRPDPEHESRVRKRREAKRAVTAKDLDAFCKGVAIAMNRLIEPLARRLEELERRPTPSWAGAFEQGKSYRALSLAVHRGALWIARVDTSAKPGTDSTWQLCVKSGNARP